MEKDKIIILAQYRSMIVESWTFNRLTTEEKDRLLNKILTPDSAQLREALKGRRGHCWDILQSIYNSYLIALDYTPIGWRETEEEGAKI